ncbi:MAG: hypothetical protein J6L81_10170 [Clostridia bacterium]|nr:hypothetical protein [Clostridia bacterium]
MRRDLEFFFPADVPSVFNAYFSAATNPQFRRECKVEPYHTLSFGLNFSVKYNMNGGSCTIRFIPFQNGTAINLRFSIVQAFGARYEAYATELTNAAAWFLKMPAQKITINVEAFMNDALKVTPQNAPASMQGGVPAPAPIPPAAPPMTAPAAPMPPMNQVPPSAPQPQNPGINIGANPKTCPACGNVADGAAAFCGRCGNKF